jgi:hypothetical protein
LFEVEGRINGVQMNLEKEIHTKLYNGFDPLVSHQRNILARRQYGITKYHTQVERMNTGK